MIPIDNAQLYNSALSVLHQAVGNHYLGRLVQMFLACKHYGYLVPRVGDAVGITTSEFETLLDDLYRKRSRTQAEKILILFAATYKVPSGIIDGDLTSPSNIWRNNLNFQKGYMCYASPAELNLSGFRNASRTMCPHLAPAEPGVLRGATCTIKGGAQYRNEDHPKVFRKSADDGRYFVYDPSDEEFYRNIVLPNSNAKLPIAAVIIALYFDSVLAAGRSSVTIADFSADFDMSQVELSSYFEDDPESEAHAQLIAVDPTLSWDLMAPAVAPTADQPLPGVLPQIPEPKVTAPKTPSSQKAQGAKTPEPPKGSHWWSAEQAVRALLESNGWAVMDVSRSGIGCDLKASKGQTLRFVEVKSALGTCSPTLTAREYEQAKDSRKSYVLAIVEYFDPNSALSVQWVQDPAHLQMTKRTVTQFFLPRSIWKKPATTEFPT